MEGKLLAYVPAGSEKGDTSPLLKAAGVTNKALMKIGGKQIISYVLKAIDDSKYIGSLIIVGIKQNELEYEPKKPVEFVNSEGKAADTLFNMVNYLDKKNKLPNFMVSISADVPFVTGEIIDRGIELLDPFNNKKDVFYPLTDKKLMIQRFPDANKRYRKFKEGTFATGDFFIFDPHTLRKPKTKEAVEKIIADRKHMLRILIKFSFLAPIRYILGTLSIENDIIPFLRQEFDIELYPYVSPDPEICMDLDYPEDIPKFERLIKEL